MALLPLAILSAFMRIRPEHGASPSGLCLVLQLLLCLLEDPIGIPAEIWPRSQHSLKTPIPMQIAHANTHAAPIHMMQQLVLGHKSPPDTFKASIALYRQL